MKENRDQFLKQHPRLNGLKLPVRVVVMKDQLSVEDIAAIRKTGVYPVPGPGEQECRLCVGETVVATGRIIKKEGHSYFQANKSE